MPRISTNRRAPKNRPLTHGEADDNWKNLEDAANEALRIIRFEATAGKRSYNKDEVAGLAKLYADSCQVVIIDGSVCEESLYSFTGATTINFAEGVTFEGGEVIKLLYINTIES